MASPVIQSVNKLDGGNIGSTTVTLTGVTAGNTLVMIFSQAPHTPSVTPILSVTDSNGAAWTEGVTSTGPDDTNYNNSVSLWYKLNGEAGSHTLTIDNTADTVDGYSIHFMEIPTATAFDASPSTRKINAVAAHTANTYTPTQSVLAFAAITVTHNTTTVGISDPPSGWVSQYANQDGLTTAQFSAIQISLLENATGALAPAWSWTGNHTSWSLVGGFILASGESTVTLTPDSDVSAGAWTPSTGATLFGVLDETSVNDADYISTTSNSTAVVGFSDPAETPGAGTRTLTYRLSGSVAKKIVVTYRGDGGTLHTFTHDPAPASLTTFNQDVTADAVSNWSTLQVGFEAADATTPPSPVTVYGAIGTGSNAAGSATSMVAGYPAGIAAGDLLVLGVVYGSSAGAQPTTPSGWTVHGPVNNTTGTYGTDTGPRHSIIYTKVADGTETGNLTLTATGNNTGGVGMIRLAHTNAGYTWNIASSTGADSTAGTGVSVTGGTALSFAPGDMLVINNAQLVDTATQSAKTITATGITFGSITTRQGRSFTNGSDVRQNFDTVPVTAGTATVAPVHAYTSSSAATQAAIVFLRVREVPPVEFGRVTWAQLEVPAGAAPPAAFVNSPCFICM